MKLKHIIVIILVIINLYGIWYAAQNRSAQNFVGSPPQASKPYNILNYTKPAAKP